MKRPASVAAAGVAKRSSRDPIVNKCNVVAAALRESEELPENVREMLAEMVTPSLSVFAAERHPFQSKTVEMVEQAMAGIEANLRAAVAEAQAKVDGAEVEKATRTSAVATRQASHTECDEKCVVAREKSESDAAALKAAKAAAALAHHAEAQTASSLDDKVKALATLKDAAHSFQTLQASKVSNPDGRKAFCAIELALKEMCGAEASMVDALGQALKKESAERGSFDILLEQQATAAFASTTTELEQSLAAGDSTKAAAAAATADAEAATMAASEKSHASAAAFDAAVVAMRSADEAFTEANESLENFDKDVATASSDLEDAKEDLGDFQEGPRVAFAELKVLAAPPAPAPAAEHEQPEQPGQPAT